VNWLEVAVVGGLVGKAEFRRWIKYFRTRYQPSQLRRPQISNKKFDSIDVSQETVCIASIWRMKRDKSKSD
jgi:hypothetical protein